MDNDQEKESVEKPLISIITVVFNGEKYLAQTIESVINQTYQNIEYIIIDGGSTDGTHDIVERYKKHISYFVSEPDEGLYDAMNKGIALAKGQLIGMINSDDWYELNTVKLMVDAYRNNPSKTIFHADRFDIDDDDSKKVRKFNASVFKFKYYGMTYNHPSMFITNTEYEKHEYNITLRSLSDYQFVLEAFLRDEKTFHYIASPLVNYRLDGISAQISTLQALREGMVVTKITGYSFCKRMLSLSVRFTMFSLYKNYLKFRAFLGGK